MKKTLLLAIFCLATLFVQAQQSILFKLKYLPGHLYKKNLTINMDMLMDISGDSAKMNKLKEKGMKLPMSLINTTAIDVDIKTGAVKNDNFFPITFKYVDLTTDQTINGEKAPTNANPLKGQTIYGQSNTDGIIKVDSIPGSKINDQIRSSLTSMITNMSKQVQFPERPLNIGETFNQEVPLSLPISGLNIKFVVKITYKLKNVKDGMAFFDLDESLTLDMSTQKDMPAMNATGEGNGTGTLIYSIPQNFATSMISNLDFKIKMVVENMNMSITAKTSSVDKTEITQIIK